MGLIWDIWCETDIRWLFVRQCSPVFVSTSGSSFAFSRHSRRITPFKKNLTLSLSYTHKLWSLHFLTQSCGKFPERPSSRKPHLYAASIPARSFTVTVSLSSTSFAFTHSWVFAALRCSCVFEHPRNVIQGSWDPWDMILWKQTDREKRKGLPLQIQAAQEVTKLL